MGRRKNTASPSLAYKHVDPAEKNTGRKRTPSSQIVPNVKKALLELKSEGRYPHGRLVAERANISPDTLYKKAKELLEQAQDDYMKAHAATRDGSAGGGEQNEKQSLKSELILAWETVDHLSIMLMKIMANAQSLMPGRVYELLAPLQKTHRHLEPY